jgi:AcrR family transcriptional regulator
MTIDSQARKQTILDSAARLIIQYGYDKTTIGDVAAAVGLNRALVYGYFRSKDDLLEALIKREMRKYGELWFEHLMSDPQGGTVASIYRSIAYALKNNPFMAAIVTRDEGTFGKYLRKPGNIFEGMQSQNMASGLLQALQDAGTIRQEVNIPTVTYIMDTLANNMVSLSKTGPVPPYDELLETIAEMFDRMLTPEDGGNIEAGKSVLRQIAIEARTFFDQIDPPLKDHNLP